MKYRLSNPLWTHLPSLGIIIAVIVYTIMSLPLPSQAATHFGFDGVPNDYGSPWMVFGIVIGISVLFTATFGIIYEVWARQEKKKSFNWFCLMVIFVGFMGGLNIGYVQYIKSGDVIFPFPWPIIGICVGAVVTAAVIFELVRPFRPRPRESVVGDTKEMEKELEKKIKSDAKFIYWSSQNPFWVTLLSIAVPVIMVAAAIFAGFYIWWVGLIVGISGASMIMMYGGLRVSVTREVITVSFGILGSNVLTLKTSDIATMELKEFSPIADFGGYGIRFSGKVSAYYLRGTRGVLFTMANGKQYLIGSDKPEELYAVVQAVVKAK